jgi:WD40 repeat protein
LLAAWGRLHTWIDEGRDDLRTQRQLSAAAAEWASSDRDESFLLRGARLERIASWAKTTDVALSPEEGEYVRACIAERDADSAVEQARRDHELQLERRSVSRSRALVAVFAIAAIVAASLTVVARRESDRAESETRVATARELAAASVSSIGDDAERAVLLAIEAVRTTRSADGSVLPEAEEALHRAVTASRIELTVPGVGGALDWSPRGVFVTEGPEDSGVIDIRDATTGQSVLSFRGDDIDVNDVAFNDEGSMLATTGDDGTLKIWDSSTGENLETFSGTGTVWSPSFSADGSLVAAMWQDESKVRVFDASNGNLVRTLDGCCRMTLSPDGTKVAVLTYADGTDVLDLTTGKLAFSLRPSSLDAAWSPDGHWLATAGDDVQIWDGTTGDLLYTLFAHSAVVGSVDWSADGHRLVTGSGDGTAKVWRVTRTGAREDITLAALDARTGITAAFSPDGQHVITSDVNITTTKIWDVGVGGDAEWMNLPAPSRPDPNGLWPGDLQFLPDGRHLVSTDKKGIAIWDLVTGAQLRTIRIGGGPISSLDVTPDGRMVAAGQQDGLVTAWGLSTGNELFGVQQNGGVVDVDWSPDGAHLATATISGSIRILDTRGELDRRLNEGKHLLLYSARFSPDGRRILTDVRPERLETQNYRETLWDWQSGRIVGSIAPGDGRNAAYVAIFDPTGSRIATSGSDGIPRIWDPETGRSLVTLGAHAGAPMDIAYSPDGSRVATAGSDGIVRLFDGASGKEILSLRGHESVVSRLAFSPDGTKLASLGEDGTVRVWALDLDDLLEIARQQVTRALTDEECRQYLRMNSCPRQE